MKLTKSDIVSVEHHGAIDFDDRRPLVVTGVSTDSREVKPGDLFIPIRGKRFDGHNFVTTAIQSGAAAVVVDRKWADANQAMIVSISVPKLVVEDTVDALGGLARIYRRKFRIPFIAVGGSNGKTTTKEMIRTVLAQRYHVLHSEGNLNNNIGVPQTIFKLEKKHTIAVLEIGTNHFGEIKNLCMILEPTHGVITNIGNEHLEFFGNLTGVARAEGELFDWLRAHKGTALVNRDDSHVARLAKAGKNTVTYGFEAKGVHIKGTLIGLDERACPEISVKPKAKKSFDVELAVPGEHNASNALAAAAVGITFRVPSAKIQRALNSFMAASKRMELMTLNGITILNDTYNSNPDSALAALATLRSMNAGGKRIAVLADMLELGAAAADQHRHVGRAVSRNGIEYLLTYGELSKYTNDAAHVKFKAHYDQKNMLSEYLAELLSPGDAVLIKGSRGMGMEDVVTFLKERLQPSSTGAGGGRAA